MYVQGDAPGEPARIGAVGAELRPRLLAAASLLYVLVAI